MNKEKGVENIPIITREAAIKELHKKDLSIIAKFPKLKPESIEKSSLLDERANIIEKK